MQGTTLPATAPSVARVAQHVTEISRAAELSPERSYKLRLAAEEIATNIIVHGYGEDDSVADPVFDLEWGCNEERVWIRFLDVARPFDPTTAPEPDDLDAPLERRRIGGLGIHLARASLDGFTYRRTGGRNCVTLFLDRDPPPRTE